MTSPLALTDNDVVAADQLRRKAESAYQSIRSDGRLNYETIQREMAKVYVDTVHQMQLLVATVTNSSTVNRERAMGEAFGVVPLAGGDPLRAAELSMYLRDATARVADLDDDDSRQAATLLRTAEDNGDELLARAVARRAWDLRDFQGWADVLSDYTAVRPAAAQAVATLANMAAPLSTRSLFWSVVPKPPELGALADWNIAALAAA